VNLIEVAFGGCSPKRQIPLPFLTIAVAALYALVSSARRKICGAFLGFLFVKLSAATILYWWQLDLSKILFSNE
jgi:hypothetical protein